MIVSFKRASALFAVVMTMSVAVAADPVEDFYKSTRIEIVVGSGVGGGYDTYARFLGRHMARHVPGKPTVLIKNMPGAGGMIAGNYVYGQAARDGSVITHLQNTLTIEQISGTPNLKLDMSKFLWIGSMNTQATICVLSGAVEFKSAKDFFTREYLIGATQGLGNSTSLVPKMLNTLVGTKFRIVTGYKSTSNVVLGIERNEVQGLCGWGWDSAQVQAASAIDAGKLKVGIDIGNSRHPDLAKRNVPFLMDMVPEGLNKDALRVLLSPQSYGRPFAAPPGVPADRLAALRKAFAATLKDEAFLAEAAKAKLQISYMPPEEIEKHIKDAFAAPEAARNKAISVLTDARKK
ncbi:MAG: hypothetical protein RLZ98_2925 [Pseudomonadota bacterium]|jgi:tripartite-type tricarboxylate transporter receptor subunit TctC